MKKLALITDVRNWAFHNIASHIERFLSDEFDIRIFFTEDHDEANFDLYKAVYLDFDADQVHYFWREQYFSLWRNPAGVQRRMRESNVDIDEFAAAFSRAINTTTVYDHMHGDAEALAVRSPLFELLDGYSVASPILESIYASNVGTDPTNITEDGIDLTLFYQQNLDRFRDTDRPMVVGWTGNSEWGKGHFSDMKGLHTIITPAIERLREQGLNVEASFADRKERWRSRDEMRDYYSSIDVLICASEFEGTPNPVLEAIACGVPVVSTRVGIVEIALTGPQSDFVLQERSVDCLANALQRLAMDRSKLSELSEHNLEQAKHWNWEKKMVKWRKLFDDANVSHEKRREARGFLLAQTLKSARELDRLRQQAKKANERAKRLQEKSGSSGTRNMDLASRLEATDAELKTAERRIANLLSALDKNRNARINYQNQLEQYKKGNTEKSSQKKAA